MPNWKKLIVSGSDAALNSLNITTSLTASGNIYPTGLGVDRQVLKTDGAGNIAFGYPEEVVSFVKNVSGGTLVKGTPVHATSSGALGNIVGIIAASASVASTMPATFVLNETLADEEEGEALSLGFIQGVNTSGFEVGEIIFVGSSGGYTNVKPTGSNLIQNIGIVTKIDPTNGSGYVLGAGRSNDIPNIQPGYVWVGDSNNVATPIATSSIQNVVSSSFATSASYAPDIVEIMYFNTNTTNLSDNTNYTFTTNTTLTNSINATPGIPLPIGTIVGWRFSTYWASLAGSSETGTLKLYWGSGPSEVTLSTAITWDGNRTAVFSGSLSQAITAVEPSWAFVTTPNFATNPQGVKMVLILQIEI
jgi:hypothetical protein